MTRHTVINPLTGRRVFKTGTIGRKIQKMKKPAKKVKAKAPDKNEKKTSKVTKSSVKRSEVTKEMNDLIFTLDIETTNTAPQHGMLLNRFEQPDSKIESINVNDVSYLNNDKDELVTYTTAELKEMTAFTGDSMTFKNEWRDERNKLVDKTKMTFKKKGGFSCWDVIQNVVKFEAKDRPKSNWFGGVDCHHIFYDGIKASDDGSFYIIWRS